MSIVGSLIAFGLRQVIGDSAEQAAGAAGQAVEAVKKYFADHGKTLPNALARANDRAWQALVVALAGDGWIDSLRVLFASGDDKGVREQVRRFLDANPLAFPGTAVEFRQACLEDLKKARKAGALALDRLDAAAVADKAADFRRYTDADGLMDGARRATADVGDALAADYPSLAALLRQPTPDGPPLLAAAFAYFFRREVETNDELARGLTFDGLRRLTEKQDQAFGEVGKALDGLKGRFDEALEGLGRIETVVVETHGAVLDLRAEMARLGGLHLSGAEEMRRLFEQVLSLQERAGMRSGEVSPQYSFSIRSEDERQAVKRLLARFRRLPADEQRQAPALLNGLGKLQVGAGEYAQARQTFDEVARAAPEDAARAEASYNAYRAALEERRWDAGLEAIRQAAELDPVRFALFPSRYQPRRILGAGGFGTAFLCRDQNFEEDVVVKTLHTAELGRNLKEVFREAVLLRRLSHPAVIGVRDCEYADPSRQTRPYIVMDYFHAVSLAAHLREHGALAAQDVLAVARRIAEGMQAAHQKGVLHRDLKPDNVLVRQQGDGWLVKVIDFGLAMSRQAVETSRSAAAAGPTILGDSVAGTVQYAPPEQLGRLPGVEPGPYSDVYAFGKLCCYALFQTTEPRSRQLNTLPEKLRNLLEQCIDQDLKHRLPSFEGVLRALGDTAVFQRRPDDADARRRAEAARQRQEREAEERRQREERQRKQQELARRPEEQPKPQEARPARWPAEERRLRESQERERRQSAAARRKPAWRGPWAWVLVLMALLLPLSGAAASIWLVVLWNARTPGGAPTVDAGAPPGDPDAPARKGAPQPVNALTFPAKPTEGAPYINSLGMRFVWIKPGSFVMGSPDGYRPPGVQAEAGRRFDEIAHNVTLTKGFHMGAYLVTQDQWEQIMGNGGNASHNGFKGVSADEKKRLPVACVTWEDCQTFCVKLGAREGRKYRLPTEAEWEYACRAGTRTAFFFGDEADDLGEYAWFVNNSGGRPHEVGTKKPNPWGLYDMHGNLYQWCQDGYEAYGNKDKVDPVNVSSGGANRVIRGGYSGAQAAFCRSAFRDNAPANATGGGDGCRVVLCPD